MRLCYVLSLRVRFLAYEISQTVVLRLLNVHRFSFMVSNLQMLDMLLVLGLGVS